jgi:hypothetical protein
MQLAISCGMEIISPLCGICSTCKTLEFCLVVHLITYNPSWLCLNHCITMTKLAGMGGANTFLQDLTKLCQQDKVCTEAHLRRRTLELKPLNSQMTYQTILHCWDLAKFCMLCSMQLTQI